MMNLWLKALVQERDKKFLTSGSKEFTDRILINEEARYFYLGSCNLCHPFYVLEK